MALTKIIGRNPQKKILQQANDSQEAEFIALYGRRRIGKTFLIREFYEKNICFEMTGIYKAPLVDQLDNFAEALGKAIGASIQPKVPKSWREAFLQLENYIISLGKARLKGKKVIFLDELPWLNTPRSKFMAALQHFWNGFCTRRKDIILVVCGSAASWMIQNIVKSKGGLHNRLTRQIRLLPFTLAETKFYLQSRNMKSLDNYSILQIYMTIGGVPYYLSKIEKGKSAAQIIDSLCFSESAPLRNEYDQLYRSLFEKSEQHIRIVESLSKKHAGLTRTELLKSVGMKSGGTASQILEELEESGFIESRIPFGRKANDSLFRLIDEFSLFHLFWIKPLGKKSPGTGYWITRQSGQKYNSWAGYSFEGICIKHIKEIKNALGIFAIGTNESPWRFIPPKGSEETGAQIDLLIDRADRTINLCEMKFYSSEFVINAKYAKELRNKIAVFREQTHLQKPIFLTLITTFGTKENSHSTSLEVIDIKMDVFFQ
jgi:AAA+ ATPase superfamily predicted ATPase